MILNPYLVITLFCLCLYFPALKCLIIVDDIRQFGAIKDRGYFKNLTPINFIHTRLYGGGTFFTFEECPDCKGKGKIQPIKVNPTPPVQCPQCKGSGQREWCRQFFGKWITGIQIDHAFAISLMCLIGCLMYMDFHSLLGKWQTIFAVLLFMSSSIVTHIAVWLNGRRYAINIIHVLLIIACINAGHYWTIFALLLYASTAFFHMTAFFVPVLYPLSIPLMALLFFVPTHIKKVNGKWQIGTIGQRLHGKVMGRLNNMFECDRKYFRPQRIIIIIKTYGFYFFKMLMPLQTRTCYGFLYMWGETPDGDKDAYAINMAFWKGIAGLGITLIGTILLPSSLQPYAIFMCLSTLQWCNIINATQVTADRYACMPWVFLCVILAHFLPWQVLMVMISVNVCFTSQSYRMYENIQGMFDYHFYHWPNITLVNKEYIGYCIKQGNYVKASALVTECLRFNPTDFALLHSACVCAKVANDRASCRKFVAIAERHLYYGQEEAQRRWINNFKASL